VSLTIAILYHFKLITWVWEVYSTLPTPTLSNKSLVQCTNTSNQHLVIWPILKLVRLLLFLPGGDAHAGFGSSKDIVRVLLFWTGSPLGVDGYDGNSQDTKVTAMIDLAKRLWGKLIVAERKQMLHLVYLCLMMSYPQYKKLCHRKYAERPIVFKFPVDVTENPDGKNRIINSYAKINRFFVDQKGTH
jgi:hypothetical protein